MKKTIIAILFTISLLVSTHIYAQQGAQEQPQAAAPSTADSEAEALKRREEELRRREEAIRQRELQLQLQQQGVQDRTNMSEDIRRQEEARRERERLRQASAPAETILDKYFVTVYGGFNYLLNPNKVDNTETSLFGGHFGAAFQYAIDDKRNVKIGIDLAFFPHLETFKYSYGSEQYNVKTAGFFILVTARYEFISRKEGNRFIPYAGICLGLMIPNMSGNPESEFVKVGAGIEGGFDVWFNKFAGINFRLRFLAFKYDVMPGVTYSAPKYLVFLMPQIGITFSF